LLNVHTGPNPIESLSGTAAAHPATENANCTKYFLASTPLVLFGIISEQQVFNPVMASKTPAAGTNADIVGTASSARGHSRSHSIPHPKRRHPAYEHEEGDHAASETILGDTASGAFVDPALDGDVGGAAAGYGSEEEAGCRREVEEAS